MSSRANRHFLYCLSAPFWAFPLVNMLRLAGSHSRQVGGEVGRRMTRHYGGGLGPSACSLLWRVLWHVIRGIGSGAVVYFKKVDCVSRDGLVCLGALW